MNLGDMRNMVKTLSGSGDEYDSFINEQLNAAYMMFAEHAQIPSEATVTTDPTYTLYPVPKDFIELDGVYIGDTKLTKIDEGDIGTDTGEPDYYYKRGRFLGFYPKADDAYTGTIHYFQYPDKMTADDQSPHENIPERYHMTGLVNYAVAKVKQAELDPDSPRNPATDFFAESQGALDEFKKQVNTDDNAPQKIKDVYGGWF